MSQAIQLLIKNIGVLATPLGSSSKRGSSQGDIQKIENACVGIVGDRIACVGTAEEAKGWALATGGEVFDAGGCLVTPGLVDSHTHLVFGGWRQYEMAQKLQGVSYLDILKSGGGILSTVNATRSATFDELYDKAVGILDQKLQSGCTTVEIKSGYGLSLEHELKQLRVIAALKNNHPCDIVATFMGAHAYPPEFKEDHEGYLTLLCEVMIPAVAESGLADYCDVFCEEGVFDIEESRRVLLCARKHGLQLKLHGDEIEPMGGAQLAAQLHTLSAEHLMATSDEGIAAMAAAGIIAVLLPATSFNLDKGYAPARKFVQAGVPVAIASDFNPGSCPCSELQLSMNLSCLKYKLTPEETLTAVTLNAAAAIGLACEVGSIEAGKKADLVIWDAPDLNMIHYRFGSNQVGSVIKGGRVI